MPAAVFLMVILLLPVITPVRDKPFELVPVNVSTIKSSLREIAPENVTDPVWFICRVRVPVPATTLIAFEGTPLENAQSKVASPLPALPRVIAPVPIAEANVVILSVPS